MDIEIDRKVVLPRIRSIGSCIDWEPRPWKNLKRYVMGMTDEPPWSQVVASARNARLLVPPRKVPLNRHDHMVLKSLYVMLHEGYVIETNDHRVCCFVRRTTDQRITTGASVILSTPFTADRSHSAFHQKLTSAIPSGIKIEDIRPHAVCFREMTYETGHFGPAYVWILHHVRCSSGVPKVRSVKGDGDSFVGAKPILSLVDGRYTTGGCRLLVNGLCDRAVLGSLVGRPQEFPGMGFRLLSQSIYDSIPTCTKPLVDERVVRMTALFAMPLLGIAWKLADEASTAEWITQKLSLAIGSIQATLQ